MHSFTSHASRVPQQITFNNSNQANSIEHVLRPAGLEKTATRRSQAFAYSKGFATLLAVLLLCGASVFGQTFSYPSPEKKQPSLTVSPTESRAALDRIKKSHRGQYQYPDGFKSGFIEAQGIRLHYVRGGTGSPIVFVHGFGSTWKMWEPSLRQFSKTNTVVAIDMPGLGQSEPSPDGYDAITISSHLWAAIQQLVNGPLIYVCHDLCNSVSYPLVALHQDQIRKVVFMESPIPDKDIWTYPGLTPKGPGLGWHFGFFDFGDVAEKLIANDPRLFMAYFINEYAGKQNAFGEEEMLELIEPYSTLPVLHAAFSGYYSAHSKDAIENETLLASGKQLRIPTLSVSGALGVNEVLPKQLIGTFVASGTPLSVTIVPDCGHWLLEQCAEPVNGALASFISGQSH